MKPGRICTVLGAVFLVLVGVRDLPAQELPKGFWAEVLEVLDGDTIRVRLEGQGQEALVRYLLLDTPERHHPRRGAEEGGDAAWRCNRRWVEGKRVFLEEDQVARDLYGRLLAYVWVPTSEGLRLVNAEILREGWGLSMVVEPNRRRLQEMREAEREGKGERRGLWGLTSGLRRRFTEKQLWAEAPFLRGCWVDLELEILEVQRRGREIRILGRDRRLFVQAYEVAFEAGEPRPGERLRLRGHLSSGPRGWMVRWIDPWQRMGLNDEDGGSLSP